MVGETVVSDDLYVGVSRDPDAPGAGGAGVVVMVEQEPAVGRFRDVKASEARYVRV